MFDFFKRKTLDVYLGPKSLRPLFPHAVRFSVNLRLRRPDLYDERARASGDDEYKKFLQKNFGVDPEEFGHRPLDSNFMREEADSLEKYPLDPALMKRIKEVCAKYEIDLDETSSFSIHKAFSCMEKICAFTTGIKNSAAEDLPIIVLLDVLEANPGPIKVKQKATSDRNRIARYRFG